MWLWMDRRRPRHPEAHTDRQRLLSRLSQGSVVVPSAVAEPETPLIEPEQRHEKNGWHDHCAFTRNGNVQHARLHPGTGPPLPEDQRLSFPDDRWQRQSHLVPSGLA
jgi:hypothetical protein